MEVQHCSNSCMRTVHFGYFGYLAFFLFVELLDLINHGSLFRPAMLILRAASFARNCIRQTIHVAQRWNSQSMHKRGYRGADEKQTYGCQVNPIRNNDQGACGQGYTKSRSRWNIRILQIRHLTVVLRNVACQASYEEK